jgi:biotin carboxyl carrier protein
MLLEIEVDGRTLTVAVHRVGGRFAVAVDGRAWLVDAVRVDDSTLSLIVGTVPPNGDTGDVGDTADPQGPPYEPGSDLAAVRRPHLLRSGGLDDVASGGHSYDVTVTPGTGGPLQVVVDATPCTVILNGLRRRRGDHAGHAGNGTDRITAPMPGKVVRVLVAAGDRVRAGQPLTVVEAMKMENELRAGRDGMVAEVHVKQGASVDAGALLFVIQ